ncbi:30S ribosomal protein S8e [Candidatus Woesearchaeota archaeon]|nr:30S ribosomal protein S8e [Candidatus Woesearchaeota archaeon]
MVIVQDRSLRKPTGGRNTGTRPKRLAQKGDNPSLTVIGSKRIRVKRTRGGSEKKSLLGVETVNLLDTKTNKIVKATLKSVKESKANRNYVRRNILTKGTVVETDKGVAVITSRPGQHGSVNAVLQ